MVYEVEEADECLFPLLKKLLLIISLSELTALLTQTVGWEWPSLEYLEHRLCTKIMQTPLLGSLTSERIGMLVNGGNLDQKGNPLVTFGLCIVSNFCWCLATDCSFGLFVCVFCCFG